MRVLVTGATGFIGRQVVDVLVGTGHDVEAVARRAGRSRNGVRWHEADLLKPESVVEVVQAAGADRLIHLAWYAVPGAFWSAPENERWIDASLRLLRAFGEHGGRRAVVAGTCAEYAWGEQPLNERDTELAPRTLYGACKAATYIAAEALAAQIGLSLGWGRVFFLYGPGEPPGRLVSGLIGDLLAGDPARTTEGRQRRDFLHVQDVAEAFVALLLSEVSGPVNIASGEAVAVRDVTTLIAESVGALERVQFGALQPRPDDPAVIEGDPRRLCKEVGFRPAIGLAEGISSTVEWWRARAAAHARDS